MNFAHRWSFVGTLIGAFFITCAPAVAQWQVPNHSVPIGRGSGTGFKSAAPGATGIPIISQGAASDPAFGTATVPGGGTGATTFTSNLPLIGNGAGAIAQGTRSGNTTTFATTTGTLTSGRCAEFDASGNIVMASAICNASTLPTGTANQIPVFSGSGNTVAATSATTWFDNAYCNTFGYVIVRLTGAWTCSEGSPINFKWLGAVGNGSTDDTTAYEAYLTLCNASGSLTLYVPPGNYVINSQTSRIVNNGCLVQGAGMVATKFTYKTNATFIWGNGASGSSGGGMRDLSLEDGGTGTYGASTRAAIFLDGGSYANFDNIYLNPGVGTLAILGRSGSLTGCVSHASFNNIQGLANNAATNLYTVYCQVNMQVKNSWVWNSATPGYTQRVTGATNATPIVVSYSGLAPSAPNDLVGQSVEIAGVGGNTAANGTWIVSAHVNSGGSGTITLTGSVGNGAYTSGGTVALTGHSVTSRCYFGFSITAPAVSDLVTIQGIQTGSWGCFLNAQTTGATYMGPWQIQNNTMDSCYSYCINMTADASAEVREPQIQDNYMSAMAGGTMVFSGAGQVSGALISGNRVRQTYGRALTNTMTTVNGGFSLIGNNFSGINYSATVNESGVYLQATGTWDATVLTGNVVGLTQNASTPYYALNMVGTFAKFVNTGNVYNGLTAGCSYGTNTASYTTGNLGSGC